MKRNSTFPPGLVQLATPQPPPLTARSNGAPELLLAKKTVSTALLATVLLLAGCQTSPPPNFAAFTPDPPSPSSAIMALREGDTVKVSFASAPNMDTTQLIRRDGKIELPLVGEVMAAGKTTTELEKEVIQLYAPQLNSKEITVTLESASFPVFVTGCVLKPGKILSDHPITALEAIMEAGGFDYDKANLKSVRVIRHDGTEVDHFTLNLKGVLAGDNKETFPLRPSDIVYVPERFTWF